MRSPINKGISLDYIRVNFTYNFINLIHRSSQKSCRTFVPNYKTTVSCAELGMMSSSFAFFQNVSSCPSTSNHALMSIVAHILKLKLFVYKICAFKISASCSLPGTCPGKPSQILIGS